MRNGPMILTNDQLDKYVGSGTEYERMLHALIRTGTIRLWYRASPN